MMPLQTIILLTTGFYLPPVLTVAPVAQPADHPVIVALKADAQPGDATVQLGDGAHAVFVSAPMHEATKDIEPGGPWLGIQFGPVPKPLAAQLGIDPEQGQMVLNVVKGSPADGAGIQQYDIITKIDGSVTSANIASFLDVVRGFQPGQTHDFGLIRNGNDTQISVTVGARPDSPAESTYKYKMDIAPFSQGKVFQRGGIIQKDPSGTWNFKSLDQLEDLPDNVWKFMPKLHSGDLAFSWKGDDQDAKNLEFSFKDGKKLQISRDDNGQITVTKTEEVNGNETTSTATYANEDELKAADPEAYKTYKGNVHFELFGDMNLPDFHFGIKGANGNFFFKGDDGQDPDVDLNKIMEHHKMLLKKLPGASGDPAANAFFFKSKPSVSFEVDPDGAIRVTIRQDDGELIENYDNAAQLQQARPELYQKYQNLKQAKPE
jgi:hypothetical protein